MGIIFTGSPAAQPSSVAAANPLAELLPGLDLAKFYTDSTGFAPDPNYFGVYAVQAIGETLYLGLGTARPAEAAGSLLAKTDGKTLKAVAPLPEQGFVAMRAAGNTLYIPGPDPTEDWSMGNVYVGKPPDAIKQHRNLPNVIHSWGLHVDADAGRVYAAVGQHVGDNQTFYGGVFVSDDDGETWSPLEDRRHVLGDYRTYDITRFGGKLYATANDVYERPSQLAASGDSGASWKRVHGQIESRPRLLATRDYLAALSWGRDGLNLVSADGRATRTRFKDFKAADWAYNYICAGYGGWYYLLADGGQIYNSRDLKTWTLVADTGLTLLSVGYWQNNNRLIVTDRGAKAGIYVLDLANYGAI